MKVTGHAIHISRVYGSHHGGSIYSEVLLDALVEQGWKVTLVAERFEPTVLSAKARLKRVCLNWFFRQGIRSPLGRWLDIARLFRLLREGQTVLVVVQGDLPRLVYTLLQYVVPVIFVRQDAILTCPANDRFLRNSRTICPRRAGFSCLAVHRRENCLSNLGLIHRMGRIVFRLRDRFFLKRLRHFVGNSKYILRVHERDGTVLYPPRLSTPAKAVPDRDLCRLAFCGRLEAAKGAEDAIRILSLLPEVYRLIILGDGQGLTSLHELARTSGISNRVAFHGWVDRLQRDAVFASSGLLLLPSLCSEAFGMVGLEAFVQGTPVVAYDVGGISEWCKPGAGILVPCGDLNGAARAITTLTRSAEDWRQYSFAAKAFAESNFTSAEFRRKAVALIESVVQT